MNYLDFVELLDGEPASLAVFSTFVFDPEYFERRLLRCSALAQARRIIIFIDATQWTALLQQEMAARYVNRRYLIVPVYVRNGGVFHPKLHLIMREQSGSLICASANLTRSGCTSNLELLNRLTVDVEHGVAENISILVDALRFYERACDDAEPDAAKLALAWFAEIRSMAPWLQSQCSKNGSATAQLVHTYDGSIWDWLTAQLASTAPTYLHIISPFYDLDGKLIKRASEQWPHCSIDLTVQNRTTALHLDKIKELLDQRVNLFEIQSGGRRLHAKLLHWTTERGHGCLVGSANFTSAAFDARNVETCLVLTNSNSLLDSLYDAELWRRPLKSDQFISSRDVEPTPLDNQTQTVRIKSAILENGRLRISIEHRLEGDVTLHCALRSPSELHANAIVGLPNRVGGVIDAPFKAEQLDGFSTGMLLTLIATVNDERHSSLPVWVIQPEKLSYESHPNRPSLANERIEQTGEGLVAYVDELAGKEGPEAAIAFLRNLNITYAGGRGVTARKFRVVMHDPYRPDIPAGWMLDAHIGGTFMDALLEFADRHEKTRLLRHARNGNLNALDNYMDIALAVARLLFVHYRRGMKLAAHIVCRFLRYVAISTSGIQTDDEVTDGLLLTIFENHQHDLSEMQEALRTSNFLANVHALLLIAKLVRREWRRQDGANLSDHLQSRDAELRAAVSSIGMAMPDRDSLSEALRAFGLLKEEEILELVQAR